MMAVSLLNFSHGGYFPLLSSPSVIPLSYTPISVSGPVSNPTSGVSHDAAVDVDSVLPRQPVVHSSTYIHPKLLTQRDAKGCLDAAVGVAQQFSSRHEIPASGQNQHHLSGGIDRFISTQRITPPQKVRAHLGFNVAWFDALTPETYQNTTTRRVYYQDGRKFAVIWVPEIASFLFFYKEDPLGQLQWCRLNQFDPTSSNQDAVTYIINQVFSCHSTAFSYGRLTTKSEGRVIFWGASSKSVSFTLPFHRVDEIKNEVFAYVKPELSDKDNIPIGHGEFFAHHGRPEQFSDYPRRDWFLVLDPMLYTHHPNCRVFFANGKKFLAVKSDRGVLLITLDRGGELVFVRPEMKASFSEALFEKNICTFSTQVHL